MKSFVSKILVAVWALFVPLLASAQTTVTPDQAVKTVSDNVLAAVREHGADYENNPKVLQEKLLEILDPSLDFASFSRGVMGRYHEQATDAQRTAFIAEFKTTLVDLYTSALIAADIQSISISDTTSSRPGRANVAMNAEAASGDTYVLQYNMAQNSDEKWLIRNIILDGVNIGLTYRNQFRSAMETENGDLERVITLWPQIIEGQ